MQPLRPSKVRQVKLSPSLLSNKLSLVKKKLNKSLFLPFLLPKLQTPVPCCCWLRHGAKDPQQLPGLLHGDPGGTCTKRSPRTPATACFGLKELWGMQKKGKATTGESLPSALEAGSTSHSPPTAGLRHSLGWKGPRGVIERSSWLHAGPPCIHCHNPTAWVRDHLRDTLCQGN